MAKRGFSLLNKIKQGIESTHPKKSKAAASTN
ncbi:hypothetical protein CCACVL1_15628 [Corchorus capsularis]|uniref:Uncharacterized protein n=1 Tax=Corchorus capsularis TaxID=210143 RepID=A0A1R3I1N3_COCAP|nr:hypothetical protein CCACVL1_15628 [Corchorus capsularis]